MESQFDHEKLKVYQKSLKFVSWAAPLIESIQKSARLRDQLDRASTSIPLNIAEGNGKWSNKDRCRYFDSARGSTLECAAALDIAVLRGHLEKDEADKGKEILAEVARMLIGLIKANDSDRKFGEPGVCYSGETEQEQDLEQEQEF